MRLSQSRPDRGLVNMLGIGDNQHGTRVISFESTTFVERRDPSPPCAAADTDGVTRRDERRTLPLAFALRPAFAQPQSPATA
jgi:hypothetical protein